MVVLLLCILGKFFFFGLKYKDILKITKFMGFYFPTLPLYLCIKNTEMYTCHLLLTNAWTKTCKAINAGSI